VLFVIAMTLGLWTLWRRETAQFPSPRASIALLKRELVSDDELAWIYLRVIAEASEQVEAIAERKASLTLWLFFATIGHLVATGASVVVCAS